MNNRKINKLIKDLKDIDVYKFEEIEYMKVEDFVKVWTKFLEGAK